MPTFMVFTPRVCARGKVISLSVCRCCHCCHLSTENQNISIFTCPSELWMAQNCQKIGKNLTYLCSYLLLTIHECDKSWFLYTTPIRHTYWGYLVMHYDCTCPSSVYEFPTERYEEILMRCKWDSAEMLHPLGGQPYKVVYKTRTVLP